MATTTGKLQAIRNGMLALGVCASLVAGSFGFTSSAEARVNDGETGIMAVLCRGLQERYDELRATWNNPNTSFEHRLVVEKEMSDVRKQWNAACSEFGSISALQVPGGSIKNPAAVDSSQVLEATENQSGPLGGKVVERAPVEVQPVLHQQTIRFGR